MMASLDISYSLFDREDSFHLRSESKLFYLGQHIWILMSLPCIRSKVKTKNGTAVQKMVGLLDGVYVFFMEMSIQCCLKSVV